MQWNIAWTTRHIGGTLWRSWLRHCATSRKVVGSIPDCVIGIFHWHKPSGRTIALGLTQPLTKMSTGIFAGDEDGRCVELTTLPPSCADCLEIWEPQPPGTLRACPGLGTRRGKERRKRGKTEEKEEIKEKGRRVGERRKRCTKAVTTRCHFS